jgi:hypothetical protein
MIELIEIAIKLNKIQMNWGNLHSIFYFMGRKRWSIRLPGPIMI